MRNWFFVLYFFAIPLQMLEGHGISYEGGSRFGDRMAIYLHARYISYITGLPFYHRSFLYSKHVTIGQGSLPYSLHIWTHKTQSIGSGQGLLSFLHQLSDPLLDPTFFLIHYIVDDLNEWDSFEEGSYLLNFHLHDDFLTFMRPLIAPKIPIPELAKPGRLNVAAHVRVLSGGDWPEWSFVNFPLRHPNIDYHKRQIQKIYEWNGKEPLYVFLFSDTENPLELLEDFKSHFDGYDIEFGIQNLERVDKDHVIQDFFAMQQFDVLISTQSNFSKTASKLGSFDMVIYPVHRKTPLPGKKAAPSEVDQVQIISRKSDWFPFELDFIVKDNSL